MEARDKPSRAKTKVVKRRITLPDGRYLIYFTFEESSAGGDTHSPSSSAATKKRDV